MPAIQSRGILLCPANVRRMQIVLDRGVGQNAAVDLDERGFDAGGADIDTNRLMLHGATSRTMPSEPRT